MFAKSIRSPRRLPVASAATLLCLQLAGCFGGGDGQSFNTLPVGTTSLSSTAYPATTPTPNATQLPADTAQQAAAQDLLTGGLGRSGLATATAPAYIDANNPTALELRRNAIHSNYRGLVDTSTNGGYGSLYGPNVDLSGTATSSEGLIPGVEYLGVLDNAEGTKRVTMAVQVPDSFDQNNPCIVVAPSSGSRGVYGAIATVSEWGLKRGCAVALTDAGKGIGLHDLTDDSVNRVDGTRAARTATATGSPANFVAQLTDAVRTAFLAAFPNRVALKHAHSQLNPEKDWGTDTLGAARYALWAINDRYGTTIAGMPDKLVRYNAGNTLVIAASVSNGGTAVLRAAELDTEGLIDAVVAGEPGASPQLAATSYGVQQGSTAVGGYGKPLYDYFSFANLYQPCAALAPAAQMPTDGNSVHNFFQLFSLTSRGGNRCQSLADNGLLTSTNPADWPTEALNRLHSYGWLSDSDTMHNAHYGLGNTTIVTSMYANAYGRFSVTDNLCGISYGATTALGAPVAFSNPAKATLFAGGNGTANGSPLLPTNLSVIVNNSWMSGLPTTPLRWDLASSVSTQRQDFGFDTALCLRALYTGTDPRTNTPLTASTTPTLEQSQRVRAGVAETLATANLRGKPTLIVSGRSDALLPVNNAARAYVAANRVAEGAASPVRYVEVTNGQHFDGFLGFSGFDIRYIPLHYYFVQALNAMYANLKSGTALPPSQVVRTTPRGGTPGAAPVITTGNVPPITATPAATDAIGFSGTAINVPN
jgi:hydroxybutyrate-dimer hydrolase